MQKSDLPDITKKGFDERWWGEKVSKHLSKKTALRRQLSFCGQVGIMPSGMPDFERAKSRGMAPKDVAAVYTGIIRAAEIDRKACLPKVDDDTKAALDIYIKQAKIGLLAAKAAME